MANAFRIVNNLNQVVQTLVKDGAAFTTIRVEARAQIEVLESNVSPLMVNQITNGIMSITEVFDAPTPLPVPVGVTSDQKEALNAANSPSADNPVLTQNDIANLIGGVNYIGTWNADTNTPAIPTAATSNKGHYYKVSVAGTTTIDGISSWDVGDWIISNGTAWEKVDNTEAVTSVAGRIGNVVLSASDISGFQDAVSSNTTVTANTSAIAALVSRLAVTNVIYADASRTDTYTETGSIDKPFKTLTDAASAATSGSFIQAFPGTYSGNVTLPDNVSLAGCGIGKTYITGNLTTGNPVVNLRDFTINGILTVSAKASVVNVHVQSGCFIANGDVQAFNTTINSTNTDALTVNAGITTFVTSTLSTEDYHAVQQTGGQILLLGCQATNNSATKAAINSDNGAFMANATSLVNSGGGESANVDNGATTIPNAFIGCVINGNITCGTAATCAASVFGNGVITGSSLLPKVTGSL